MIIIPSINKREDLSLFNSLSTPLVILDREIEGINKDTVMLSNKSGAYNAVKYLIDNGHKKIIILGGPESTKTVQKRVEGWRKAMEENDLYDEKLIFYGDFTIKSGYQMMKTVIESFKGVDAIFACNDIIAIGAMQAASEMGIRIPEHISVVGFDDIFISQFLKPSLTTVKAPLYEEGKTAAEILLDRIKGNKEDMPKRVIVETNLIIRDSVLKK